ncbi:hypothetical protein HPB49_021756 [Dermacentor silvarum]|uniref:Uncharacterized protein n=1 Tax=Dermacentor silvarum TaxID=543639 RepID=A0ACB8CBD2_DERSI|nr:hypothetical protein HPB49_021756 [Dermacentor silvarum]
MNDEIASKRDYGAATPSSGALHLAAGQNSRHSIGGMSGTDPVHPTSSPMQKGSNASVDTGSGHSSRGSGATKEFSPPVQPPTPPSVDTSVGSPLPLRSLSSSDVSQREQERSSPGHVAEEYSGLHEARQVPGKALISMSPNAFVSRKGSQPSKQYRLPNSSPPKTGRSSARFSPPVSAFHSAKDTSTKSTSSLIGGIPRSSSRSERLSSPGRSEVKATLPSPMDPAVKNAQALPKSFQPKRDDHGKFPSGTDGAVITKDPPASEANAVSEKKVSTAAPRYLSRKQGVASPDESCTSFKRAPQSDLRSAGPLPQERRVSEKGFLSPSKHSPSPGLSATTEGGRDIRSGAGRPEGLPSPRPTSKSPSSSSTVSLASLVDERRFASGGSLSFTGLIPAGEAAARLPTQLRGRPPPYGLGRVVTTEPRRKASRKLSLFARGSPAASTRQASSSPFANAFPAPSRSSRSSPGVYSARDAFYGSAFNTSSPLASSRTISEASSCPSSEKIMLRRGPQLRSSAKASELRRETSSSTIGYWLCKPALAVALVALVAFVTWVVVKRHFLTPRALVARVCESRTCRYYADLMISTMDADRHPCDNFYEHVCGRWTREGKTHVADVNWASFLEEQMTRIVSRASSGSAGDAEDTARNAARYIKACLAPLSNNNVDEVKLVLAAGGILWPSEPHSGQADFLSALFYMVRRVGAPIFFDVTYTGVRERLSVLISRDATYDATYAKITEHVHSLHAQNHYHVCCEAFAGPGDHIRCERLFNDFVQMKRAFDDYYAGQPSKGISTNPINFQSYAPRVSEARWTALFEMNFNVTLRDVDGVVIEDLRQFASVFQLLERYGEEKMLDLLGWLSIQVLIHYTNKGLIDSFYRVPDIASNEHRQLCFTTAYMAFGYAVNRLLLEDAKAAIDRIKRLAQNRLRPAFSALLRRSTLLRGSSVPEPSCVKLERTFDIIEDTFSSEQENSSGDFSEVTDHPLENRMALSSYLRSAGRTSAREYAHRPYWSYGAFDSTLIDGFRMNPQHFALPWYANDAPAGALVGGILLRLASALFMDYVERSHNFNATYEVNHKCLHPRGTSARDGRDVQAVTAALNVVASLYEESPSDSAVAPMDSPLFSSDGFMFAFACWLYCGDAERGSVMCNTPLRHNPRFSRAFACPQGSYMNPVLKCTLHV